MSLAARRGRSTRCDLTRWRVPLDLGRPTPSGLFPGCIASATLTRTKRPTYGRIRLSNGWIWR